MFDFFKPACHTALTRSDWAAIETAATVFSDTLRKRFQGLDTEIEGLRKEVAELRDEIAGMKREPRLSLSQKLNQKGK